MLLIAENRPPAKEKPAMEAGFPEREDVNPIF
jgi:hypothetical protein